MIPLLFLLSFVIARTPVLAAAGTNLPGKGGGGRRVAIVRPPPPPRHGGVPSSFPALAFRTAASFSASSAASNPLRTFLTVIQSARRHLVAAAIARSVSIVGMYPLDTIKTRIMTERPNPWRLQGLYDGVDGSLLGQVPYGVLTFGSYEMYKQTLLSRFPSAPPAYLYALSAVLGDVTGSGWLCPSEVIKQQTQAGMYSNARSAAKGIWSKRGWKGFYSGYAGGLARDVPFRVAQLTSYEVCKGLYLRAKKRRRRRAKEQGEKETKDDDESTELSPVDAAVCGAVAGTFSAAVTTPLDRIRTLLMTDGGGVGGVNVGYGGTVSSCAAQIWKEEGLKGFFAGIVPRVSYIAPSVVLFFVAYEQARQRLAPKEEE